MEPVSEDTWKELSKNNDCPEKKQQLKGQLEENWVKCPGSVVKSLKWLVILL